MFTVRLLLLYNHWAVVGIKFNEVYRSYEYDSYDHMSCTAVYYIHTSYFCANISSVGICIIDFIRNIYINLIYEIF